jgi:hypothetical protein
MRSTGWESKNPTLFWLTIFLLMCLTASMSFNFFQYFYYKAHCGHLSNRLDSAMSRNIDHVRDLERQELGRQRDHGAHGSHSASVHSVNEGAMNEGRHPEGNRKSHTNGQDSNSEELSGRTALPSTQSPLAKQERLSDAVEKLMPQSLSKQTSPEKPGQWINSTEQNQKILLDVGANCGMFVRNHGSNLPD